MAPPEKYNKSNERAIVYLITNISKYLNLDINKSHSYIAKAIEAETSETTTSDTSITTTETFTDDETIDLAANTNNLTLITGASDKNITYMQILQKPNDLGLNLSMQNSKVKLEIINKPSQR